MPEVVLAIDVGGTKMALALVDDEGTVLAEDVRPTRAEPDPLRVVEPLLEGITALVTRLPA
ncbi:MAG: ROK family protein, partial [Janthinobacterium lividum]